MLNRAAMVLGGVAAGYGIAMRAGYFALALVVFGSAAALWGQEDNMRVIKSLRGGSAPAGKEE